MTVQVSFCVSKIVFSEYSDKIIQGIEMYFRFDSFIPFHNPHSVILIPPSRQPLQLHVAASDARRDGAARWGTLPSPGAEQPTPLCEELFLP